MIVVADTSAINYLIQIGSISVLQTLFGQILIPHAVHEELLDLKAPPAVRQWAQNPPSWLELMSPSAAATAIRNILDPGEAEAITLAEELRADWLLIDEADGRDEAIRRGLRTIGTLGILRDAHRSGLLDFHEALEKLRSTGFYISDRLIALIIASL